ncbi:MAG: FYDLN acid domain-containing protein [Myxococcales bacterium]|nr:FYDLN acid domain-containing protein [Myxococcales bacterium]MCB9732762.1 FYDLN acid domain-containing protein [Deltaproteobacteria bacterium]
MVIASASKVSKDLGTKHVCNCGARFYDLNGKVAACPKCKTAIADIKPPEPAKWVATSSKDASDEDDDQKRSRILGGLDDEEIAMAELDDMDRVFESLDDGDGDGDSDGDDGGDDDGGEIEDDGGGDDDD